ncbi:YfiR/HmsC family protein [Simiduia agarivorans]|uniref:Uncharacterized protein n=1 Tax=Simiduia agarivorans (strain DSM 21679 / JCM 13881 / BCRC 17597 / SA1) TaxID=1117647 RepID=K4L3W3_SIMAS|nr:YfiR/HmsC family protein [Simiduia agarivorans]AFV00903.1 hypothetical protein M5M_18870 [Simiduia agarivorans SA1 = DSM 21679]
MLPHLKRFALALFALLLASGVQAKPLPSQLTAAIILKLASLEARLQDEKDISIWIINDPALARVLEKRVGKTIGRSTLRAVHTDLPAGTRPDLVYINSQNKLPEFVARANQLGAISMTPFHNGNVKDVTVLIYDDQGLPAITINMPASRQLNLQWDPSVLEISDVIY